MTDRSKDKQFLYLFRGSIQFDPIKDVIFK
jgi:hypothetical protein